MEFVNKVQLEGEDASPGIIREKIYYFENLKIKRDHFTVGVFKDKVVRVEPRRKRLLGQTIDGVILNYENRKYKVHKVL